MKGKRVNQSELVEILGIDPSTAWAWHNTGMPIDEIGSRGKPNLYDTRAVIDWLLARERQTAPKTTKDELVAVELDIRTMHRDQLRGTLVPAAEVKPLWDGMVLAAAAFMTGRHSRLAAMIEAAPGIEEKRALLKKEDAAFLTKLGAEGERMQDEVEALLATLPAGEASAFLQRVAGDDQDQAANK